jgi:hypothetical protein
MANIFEALPAPAANGAGAWVDLSAFGGDKTITVTTAPQASSGPVVTIEVSEDAGPTASSAIATFQGSGEQTISVPCRYARAVVSSYVSGAAPVVEVGGQDAGTITWKNANAGSAAANRFQFPGAADVVQPINGIVTFIPGHRVLKRRRLAVRARRMALAVQEFLGRW